MSARPQPAMHVPRESECMCISPRVELHTANSENEPKALFAKTKQSDGVRKSSGGENIKSDVVFAERARESESYAGKFAFPRENRRRSRAGKLASRRWKVRAILTVSFSGTRSAEKPREVPSSCGVQRHKQKLHCGINDKMIKN